MYDSEIQYHNLTNEKFHFNRFQNKIYKKTLTLTNVNTKINRKLK